MLSEPGATHQSASAMAPRNALTDDVAGAHRDRPSAEPTAETELGNVARAPSVSASAGRAIANLKLQGGPGAFGAANARPIVVYRQC